MSDPCAAECCALDALERRQKRTLKAVLAVNAGMFVVELSAGLIAGSSALLADSLDMLGDALAYGVTLYAVGRGLLWKARAALFKGVLMWAFGLFVLVDATYKAVSGGVPHYETMGIVGLVALLANALCLGLLWRHRSDDLNMRSVWLCSRNDILANVAVIVAAALVYASRSVWPDVVVGLGIAILFLRSATGVTVDASRALRQHPAS
ncbi:cation transporter [Sulfurifustis variabilis]|uniref:Cation transporter n=1 Tax=Sulfurifustis variabilis TaxID=1675686 RepID=A0A1B4V1R9_9GAMM|nr:cation diffusion facilitator family transporter [Sulfurifustis variabilis]BAU47438.1 cation transporter [Sulfurifustis variabilis]